MRIYFMGICGTAMGNAALLMRELGHEVLGADTGVYPPMSDMLAAQGIDILEGYDPARLAGIAPDLVVIGNAMSRGHPEVEWLLETRALPYTSLPALLGDHLLNNRRNVVVAGTHGKTTTTAMCAYLLRQHGMQPGWLVGGVPRDLPLGATVGDIPAPFIIEGDEYDSAFFDKRSKFIHYRPHVLILNNLEFDHGDIFRDLEDIQRTFRHVTRIVPRNGFILYNGDESELRELMPIDWCRCISVGTGADNTLRIRGYKETRNGASFQLSYEGTLWGKVAWKLPGLYNARNGAMAALAAGLVKHADDPFCAIDPDKLGGYQGVKRRQEVLIESEELVVMEDFGHHPTAITGTLESLRNRYPGWRITACFEPRSNTAATNRFQKEFTDALALADAVYLAPVHRGERYADGIRLDTTAMAKVLNASGKVCAGAFATHDKLLEDLVAATANKQDKPRLVIFFSNGSFGGVIAKYTEAHR